MEHYLILAKYTKSGKNIWWVSSTEWLWKKGQKTFLSGTTTEVIIIDVVEITEDQYELYK